MVGVFFCYDKAEFSHICMNSYRHSELLLPGLLWDSGVAQGTARAVHVQAVIPHQCHCQVLHGGQGEGFVSRLRVCDCLLEQRWHHFSPAGKRRQRRAAWGCGRGMLLSGNCVVSGGEGALVILLHISPILWKQSDGHCHLKGLACLEILFFGTVSIYSSYIRPYMTCCLFGVAVQCVGFDH